MLEPFYEYVEGLFPIAPYEYDHEKVRDCIKQFRESGQTFGFSESIIDDDDLCQGDVLDSLPFKYYDDSGEEYILKAKAMLISTSCSIENEENIVVAPLIDLAKINVKPDLKSIEKNIINQWMHIPDSSILANHVVDFSLMCSYPKKVVLNFLELEKAKKILSLNQLGYYLLLCKLTIYFMRPEAPDVIRTKV
ncbi:MAG: hypothetical protein RR910_01350 [Acidaminococcaceae bacterium]